MKITLTVSVVSWILYVAFAIASAATAPAPMEVDENFVDRALNSGAWAGLATLAFAVGIVSTILFVVMVISHKLKSKSQAPPP